MSDCSSVSARSRLFRARPRRDPTAGTSFRSQAAKATGRRFASSAVRVSRRYEHAAPLSWILNQTARCVSRASKAVHRTRTGGSAAERVADRRADFAHGVMAHFPDRPGERRLSHRVDAVAVDDRRSGEPDLGVAHVDLGRQATDGRRDLGNCYEIAHVDDFRAGQDQNRPLLSTDLSQPELASPHSSPQASASVQNASGRSGCRW